MLTTVPWRWANRSKVSDYRWASTPIVVDPHGVVTEVRVGNWLRAPLDAEFDRVEAAYAAYRALFDVTLRDDLTVRLSWAPGDLLAFDNRRILHGRDAYVEGTGVRFLRGCYGERDELLSTIRILERQRRERQRPKAGRPELRRESCRSPGRFASRSGPPVAARLRPPGQQRVLRRPPSRCRP